MTVKIIDEIPDPSVVKRCVCRNCGCKLEYVPNDVERDYSTDYTGSKDYYNFITCAKCRKEVRL